ncbi:MAG: tRNA (adenosine(37)-N6)-threonylcarbamoyltransferase complex ATPase subunit type 1 TsaE, partial [Gammaproteobacteria bacterium]|nr:tRNA (adenosine(37)-N6)-threonylcarbamoyltransferase complex ATPase subunit type 1 TsaE [Gammaproteobacteria bacterium]
GAGKTTLVRGMLRGLGHVGPVKSPTFSVLEPYESERFELYHFDLYRLADGDELEMIGARDYFRNDAICVFEWPERAHGWLPAAALVIVIEPLSPGRAALEREPNDDDRSGPAPEGRWVELRAHHRSALALLDALDTLAPADARCLIPRGRA